MLLPLAKKTYWAHWQVSIQAHRHTHTHICKKLYGQIDRRGTHRQTGMQTDRESEEDSNLISFCGHLRQI